LGELRRNPGGTLPAAYTNATMEQRPGVTGRPGVGTPRDTKSPAQAGVELPGVPSNAELDKDGELERNAQAKLQESLDKLIKPDANIGQDFNDAWIKRLGSGAVPYTGLNTDFTRQTGVNDASHKKTLRYSRLVDALNNKRFISPGQAGVRSTYANNGGRSGRSDSIDFGQVYKMDGLETAESRAQRRAEGYEEEDTKRGIKRKHDVMDMPATMERLKQLAVLEQAGKLTDAMRAEQQQLFTSLLHNQYNIPYMMMQDKFRVQLGMSQQQYNTALAMQMAQYAAENGLTTQQYAAMLGMDQARYGSMLGMVTNQFGTQLSEYIQRVARVQMPLDMIDIVTTNPDYITSAMQGNAFGVGAPDLSVRLFAQGLQAMGVDILHPDMDKILAAIRVLEDANAKAGVEMTDAARRTNNAKEQRRSKN
jgi:hypothetical protein